MLLFVLLQLEAKLFTLSDKNSHVFEAFDSDEDGDAEKLFAVKLPVMI